MVYLNYSSIISNAQAYKYTCYAVYIDSDGSLMRPFNAYAETDTTCPPLEGHSGPPLDVRSQLLAPRERNNLLGLVGNNNTIEHEPTDPECIILKRENN